MRLGVDASNLRMGGGRTHLIELLRVARPAEHGIDRVTVWASRSTVALLSMRHPWLQIRHEPTLDRGLAARLAWQRFRLPSLARAACDLLFVPGGAYGGTFRPFVTMMRNMLPFEPGEARRYGVSWMRVKLALLRAQQISAFRRADGIIFLNEYARQALTRIVRRTRGMSAVVPHGVHGAFRRSPQPPRPLRALSDDHPLRLLYVSTVDVYKHQWRVVEAVASLRRQGLPVALTLVGGAYPSALRRLRREVRSADAGETFIRYRGEVPYRELPSVYHHAETFVFASSCETMPNVLLEAMAAGLPIACAARGPMPGILGDGGVYFDPDDSASIGGAVRTLVEDPSLRASVASLAYRKAQTFTWERCATETLGFLRRVAANGSH